MNKTEQKDEYHQELIEKASTDIRYLIENGYRRDSSVRFVGDHYRLGKNERYILERTVFSTNTASSRKKKKISCDDLRGKTILVDGYNVLITLESILRGEKTWTADDSFLRDIRGVFRNHTNDKFTTEAVEEMASFLAAAEVESVEVLLDSQMKHSGELAASIRTEMEKQSIKGDARTSKHVDFDLKNCDPSHVVATADGVIIDSVEHVIDIPGCIALKIENTPLFNKE